MLRIFSAAAAIAISFASCQSGKSETVTDSTATATKTTSNTTTEEVVAPAGKPASNAEIIARKQVPILCYHQIRDWRPKDSKTAKDYIVPIASFKEKIKMLADSGYHTILPDQLYAYLTTGAKLPSKPIMLTFDDTDLDQFTIANPELKKYGFKAVYFIMTVSIGRPNYMNKEQIKQLADEGNVIGSHTWDHHNFKKFAGDDWKTQIDKPTKKLEDITGKKITYFAYPFGLWNAQGLPELHSRGFKMAFQLAEKRDPNDPLMTVRRILDSGYWSAKTLSNSIRNSF
ncbi:polysaccharide deacetylase family protein [Mucilaginibacter terrae]|uniref:Peptidoglycan/xylan/chitin deacetylase (PgdA/CDA1 family) n=1 Tax=Mucilaginibacter terrae TaxID=1955052 RepID=A0ABU3GUR7_9SPHI|nr:polysaccharide deacetylase family protein [Mucilaginibacter terrae]MDT3402380.1 peptidoglycan/xylan/chitin deacetylase (PgdA/CDA1 family) [Mucilaginibacter terrae]